MKRALDMTSVMSKEHPQREHFYGEYLGVVPDCQGQGMGSLITRSMIEMADRQQAGAYLETANPRNVLLYERLGFRTVREKEILGRPMWFMWRDPGAVAGSSSPG